jgi:hypothetical protein
MVAAERPDDPGGGKSMTAEHDAYWREPGEEPAVWVMGGLYEWKALGEQNGREYSLCEVRGPEGFAVPMHLHERENEGSTSSPGT